jgi:transposase
MRLEVVLVALERPDGLLIERLLDAGLAVVAVHPNQVKAMRPRFSVAGGKSDSFDSFVLAELARSDSHRFRVLEPDSDQTKALRAMTRARDGLVRTRVGLANQLRDQLATFWPGASKVFWSVDSQIALAFLTRDPTPADTRGLGEQRLAAFLKRHGYPGRKPARELLGRLREGAEGRGGARDPSPTPGCAGARLGLGTGRRTDQRADHRDPPRAGGAPRRAHVPLTVHRP